MKRNDLIFILASSVILTIAWIIFNVIHASTASTISSDLNQQIEPIAPVFDIETINSLGNRQQIVPLYSGPSPVPSITITPPLQPTVPNSSSTLSPAQSASEGGAFQ
jgi:hypothetical protein